MKFPRQILPSLIFSVGASLGLVNAPAIAFTVTQNNNRDLLREALLGSDPNNYKGLSNFTTTLIGDARAFGKLTDDPFGLGDAVALSTGRVVDLAGVNSSSTDLFTDLGLPGVDGDSISMILSFDVDDTVDTLFFQYVFGSEEFLEFAGSQFNDSFSLKLNGSNYALLSNADEVNINNIAGSPNGPFRDYINNPVGTGPASSVTKLDGYTVPLLYNAPLIPGQRNTLFINIADSSDGIYDSGVFIKAGTFGTVCPVADCTPSGTTTGTPSVPEPGSSPISFLVAVLTFIGLAISRRQNSQQ